MEGVRGAANFFVLLDVAWYLLLKVPLVCLDGPRKIRVQEMTKHGGAKT